MPEGRVQSLVTSRLSRCNDRRTRLLWGGERLSAARRRSALGAAGFPCHQGRDSARIAIQANPPWPERLETAHLRAVFAREGPVQRQGGLVGPAAIAAVPAPESRLHNAPGRPASDFNLVATRLRCRPSASPQSPAPEAVVVALPMDSRWLVVQWRRVRPSRMDAPRPAASIARPDVSEFHCRCLISMRDTPLSAETGGGHSIVVGSRSVRGSRRSSLHPTLAGAPEAPPLRGDCRRKPRPNHACARDSHRSIVGRGQLQRKQRLDAVGRRSAPGAGRARGRSADWLETLAPLLAPESLRDDVEGRPLLGGDAASQSQTLRDAARSLGDLATGVHDARDALLTLLR